MREISVQKQVAYRSMYVLELDKNWNAETFPITRSIEAKSRKIQKMLDAEMPKKDPVWPIETVGRN
jgi:hypothetical protein